MRLINWPYGNEFEDMYIDKDRWQLKDDNEEVSSSHHQVSFMGIQLLLNRGLNNDLWNVTMYMVPAGLIQGGFIKI